MNVMVWSHINILPLDNRNKAVQEHIKILAWLFLLKEAINSSSLIPVKLSHII